MRYVNVFSSVSTSCSMLTINDTLLTFTNSISHSEKHQRLVHGMVQLGKSMNLTVIAEGVETEEQKELLSSFGCDALQGYYISKPIAGREIPSLIN